MIIHKVLNNNVVIVLDNNHQEQVVTGRGLAFKKKVGDSVDEEKITQIFKLDAMNSHTRAQELLEEIPIEIMEVVERIISYAKSTLGKELNESVYLSLMDHLNNAIEREKQQIQVKNILLWDIKRFFPDEFSVGKVGLEMVNEKMNVRLSEEEAGFIALHLVNSEMSEEFKDIYELTEVMSRITNIVKYHFNSSFDEQSVYFDRFTTHLKFFAYRLLKHTTYEPRKEDDLFDMVKMKYQNEFNCTEKIRLFLEKEYSYEMTSEEQLYLIIHIAKLVQSTQDTKE